MLSKKVCIVGAGIAGLTAAHELIKKGFDVHVYEQTESIGGKAKSELSKEGYPAEHGYRVYGDYKSFYQTLSEIQVQESTSALDNLVGVGFHNFFIHHKPIVYAKGGFLSRIGFLFANLYKVCRLTSFKEMTFFCKEICLFPFRSERYLNKLRSVDFWSFLNCDNKSPEFQRYIGHWPQVILGIPANESPAYETFHFLSTFHVNFVSPFRKNRVVPVMNAPSSVALFEPWKRQLSQQGVTFHLQHRLEKVAYNPKANLIEKFVFSNQANNFIDETAEYYIFATSSEVVANILPQELRPHFSNIYEICKYHYCLNGIQLYLQGDFVLASGILRFEDSPWDLTACYQDNELWPNTPIKPPVRAILSLIVANWTEPGILYNKSIMHCSKEEIIAEILAQIAHHLKNALRVEHVHSYHIDRAIQFAQDGSKIERIDNKLYMTAVNMYDKQPQSSTYVSNLFLAGDYLDTGFMNGSMESANRGGKMASEAVMKALS